MAAAASALEVPRPLALPAKLAKVFSMNDSSKMQPSEGQQRPSAQQQEVQRRGDALLPGEDGGEPQLREPGAAGEPDHHRLEAGHDN